MEGEGNPENEVTGKLSLKHYEPTWVLKYEEDMNR